MTEIDTKRLYEEVIGFVPPEISARIEVGLQTDPALTKMFEDLRIHVMEPDALDTKTVQLMIFGMMAAKLVAAPTRYHAVAAKMAGAGRDELHAVAGLALLVGGMRSYNMAGAAIAEAFENGPTD